MASAAAVNHLLTSNSRKNQQAEPTSGAAPGEDAVHVLAKNTTNKQYWYLSVYLSTLKWFTKTCLFTLDFSQISAFLWKYWRVLKRPVQKVLEPKR